MVNLPHSFQIQQLKIKEQNQQLMAAKTHQLNQLKRLHIKLSKKQQIHRQQAQIKKQQLIQLKKLLIKRQRKIITNRQRTQRNQRLMYMEEIQQPTPKQVHQDHNLMETVAALQLVKVRLTLFVQQDSGDILKTAECSTNALKVLKPLT